MTATTQGVQIADTSLVSDANLQFYMKFEDNWNDSSANGYHLSPTNSPTFVTGKFGKAGNFVAASSQKATRAIASMGNVAVTTTQSWMGWLKIPTLLVNNYMFGISNGGNWFVSGSNGGEVTWGSGLSVSPQATPFVANEFAHFAFTYNSSTNKISSWFNGVINQNQVSVTGTFTKTGNTFGVGNIGDYAGYGTFIVDDLAMFNREITQADVDKIFPSPSGGSPIFFGNTAIA